MEFTNVCEWFRRGVGIGGRLTSCKRFNVLPEAWRYPIPVGDLEHFESDSGMKKHGSDNPG